MREYYREMAAASEREVARVVERYTRDGYRFRGVHPFNELSGADSVAATLWEPLYRALKPIQRRQDVFMAGANEIDGQIWVCSMGHLTGLLDSEWLGVPANGKLVFLRYAEFHRIEDDCIAETGFFCDLISVMEQLGLQPLPLQTGTEFIVPGPRTHDGLLFERQSPTDSVRTLSLVNRMRGDLREFRESNRPLDVLKRTWHDNVLWFGPSGIGSTYTITRYQAQHQGPFRDGLSNMQSKGHICRIAEGTYASWFGWPNLTMTATGGFLGLRSNPKTLDMRVVDVYRREGEKLSENWIFIDLLHWLLQQGVDVLKRTCREARRD